MHRKNHLDIVFLTALLSVAAPSTYSKELTRAYTTNFSKSIATAPVYKFTDSNGNITYSSFAPTDFIQIEKITITSPPSDDYAEDTRQRHNILKITAEELGEAREQREAVRADKEKKRLERLALINQSKPQQPIYQRSRYASYPYRWPHYGYGRPHYPVQLPVHRPIGGHPPSTMPLPPSSFPPMFGR